MCCLVSIEFSTFLFKCLAGDIFLSYSLHPHPPLTWLFNSMHFLPYMCLRVCIGVLFRSAGRVVSLAYPRHPEIETLSFVPPIHFNTYGIFGSLNDSVFILSSPYS